ncbi:hypothetical protein [Halorubrum lacusprofundi]|jgi:hypothetical protein|uniref:STAS/SEC14 domain-containing protein n=1 Tax=Halorubrum lacusprofundi (strain ATCC 49239 / DSM 5036 / JCM 8891 / ACAM 34) TaxID=416348 RepID=B9LRV7_HALLT|nr:hypothetical protein [Halorubrum lacusprofundi]ACM57831.1 conserved hypothetical protein [Halorubrum lacusprofundi ATCC 49239]MCG1007016.1 hypothetical protein [Halorubrum lacusprofundi]
MEPSDRWSIRVDDGVLVVEFPHGTGLSPSDSEALLDRWRTLAVERRIDAVVLVVRTSRPCSDAGRQMLRLAAQAAAARGVGRFAVVAERPKRRYLERTMDVKGIDAEPFNDAATAVRWAKCPSEPTASVVTE